MKIDNKRSKTSEISALRHGPEVRLGASGNEPAQPRDEADAMAAVLQEHRAFISIAPKADEISESANNHIDDVEQVTTSTHTILPSTLLPFSEAVYRRTFITLVGPPPDPTQPPKPVSEQTIKPSEVPQSSLAPPPPSVPAPAPTEQPKSVPEQTQKPAPAPPPQPSPSPQSTTISQSREPTPQTSTQSSASRTRESKSTTTTSVSLQPTDTAFPPLTGPKQTTDEQPDSTQLSPPPPKGLSRGAEVGIVIGTIAFAAVLLCAVMFYCYRRKPSRNTIFTNNNPALVPTRKLSKSHTRNMSSMSSVRRPLTEMRLPPAIPVADMSESPFPQPSRPLPPLPTRQSHMSRGQGSFYIG